MARNLLSSQMLPALALIFVPTTALAANNGPVEIIVASLGMLLIAGFVIYYSNRASQAAEDPLNADFANQESITLKLESLLNKADMYSLAVIRQSGHVERVTENLSAKQVTQKVQTTMKRAKIDAVSIVVGDDRLELHRTLHNGRGRQEGKRIGGFTIIKDQIAAPKQEVTLDTIISLQPETSAEKAIMKAFLRAADNSDEGIAPEDIVATFDVETGEGNGEFHYNEVVLMLIYSSYYLMGEAPLTPAIREQLSASETDWQRTLGNNLSVESLLGVHAFGDSSPQDVKQAFIRYWKLCEHKAGDDQTSLTAAVIMQSERPAILDAFFD